MWLDVCEFFRQSFDERQERWFKHVHWLDQAPYNYQCYGAFFLLQVKKDRGGVLLTDEMGLEKVCLTILW